MKLHEQDEPIEGRIRTVLESFGRAEPDAGMQDRLREALSRHARAAAAGPQRTGLLLPRLATLGAAAVVVGVVAFSTNWHGVMKQDLGIPKTARLPADNGTIAPPHARSTVTTSRRLNPPLLPLRHVSAHTRQAQKPEVSAKGEERSFPAPPLPLTEQERLLIQLVHRDDPVQLAQLAPAAREAELKRDREQVREFFKAPPMLSANFTLEPYPMGGNQ